jgi:hypothetical protein
MKQYFNLVVLLVLLLSLPAALYYMVSKTYANNDIEQSVTSTLTKDPEIALLKMENAKLRKENAELKARQASSLSQPPRRVGTAPPYRDSY